MPKANSIDTLPKTGERFLLEYRPYRYSRRRAKWVPTSHTKIVEVQWNSKKGKVVEWGGENGIQYIPGLNESNFIGWFPDPRR